MKREILYNLVVVLTFGMVISIIEPETISWINYVLNVMISSMFIMVLGMARLATATIPMFKKEHKKKEYAVEVLVSLMLFIICYIIINIYAIQIIKENINLSIEPLVVMRFGVFILSKISKVDKSENLLIYINPKGGIKKPPNRQFIYFRSYLVSI